MKSSMYKVDGLIQYYFQRKISGTAFTEIRRSLEKQQHMADEDRKIILREVERKAQVYHQRMMARRLNRILLLTGSLLIILALLFLYAVQTGTISYPRWPAWPSIVLVPAPLPGCTHVTGLCKRSECSPVLLFP
ncbi:MAG: hypothetical protein U5L96_04630 [Owenweeksia sp.]|nr:hypothetical protein [Owenweeksia sp.]